MGHSAVAISGVGVAAVFLLLSLRAPEQYSGSKQPVFETGEPIAYFIAAGSGVQGFRESDHDLARLAFEAWSRESGGRLRFAEVRDEASARIRLRWVSVQDGFFGETRRIPVQGKPGAVLFVMPDVSQLGPALAEHALEDELLRDTVVYLTCVHELGHAIGLGHTTDFDDIMYSFAYGGDIVEYFLRYREKLGSRQDVREHSSPPKPEGIFTCRTPFTGSSRLSSTRNWLGPVQDSIGIWQSGTTSRSTATASSTTATSSCFT